MSDWDSKQYMKFEKERTQPSKDLISRICGRDFNRILDLGCGPGNSTNIKKAKTKHRCEIATVLCFLIVIVFQEIIYSL